MTISAQNNTSTTLFQQKIAYKHQHFDFSAKKQHIIIIILQFQNKTALKQNYFSKKEHININNSIFQQHTSTNIVFQQY